MALSKQNYIVMLAAWKEFLETGRSPENVRPVIAESWARCRREGINQEQEPFREVKEKDLEGYLLKHQQLIEVASPLIMMMHQVIDQTGFNVILTDSRGIVLRNFGKGEEDQWLDALLPGTNMSEEVMGTNGIGLTLETGEPTQVFGPEHYNAHLHSLTCAAAPIYGPERQLVGVIDICGPYLLAHQHTLGMAISLAKAIEKELNLQETDQRITLLDEFFKDLTNTKDSGLIAFDENGKLVKINARAVDLLGLSFDEAQKTSFNKLFLDSDFVKVAAGTREVNVKRMRVKVQVRQDEINVKCYLRFLWGADLQGCVCRIKPIEEWDEEGKGSETRFTFADIIGENIDFRNSVYMAKRAAKTDSKILLQGESGTGKEVFAQSIHNLSNRRDAPFVAINCGAIPRDLIESELFGYEEGAFTGARRGGQKGKFELAQGGTIFLDEIGELPYEMQAKLLRVLEENKLRRVGGNRVIDLDCRVIAATNRNLLTEVKEKRFRDDLYYRLSVLNIPIPPLRDRKEDIPHLINHFMYKISKKLNCRIVAIDPEVMSRFYAYRWPGNIRELENVIERALLLCDGECIKLEHLPAVVQEYELDSSAENRPARGPVEQQDALSLKEVERQTIIDAIKEASGNISKAARLLGIGRNTLYRKMEKYKIDIA